MMYRVSHSMYCICLFIPCQPLRLLFLWYFGKKVKNIFILIQLLLVQQQLPPIDQQYGQAHLLAHFYVK